MIKYYFSRAQQWASQMNSMNPEFVQQMRDRLNISMFHFRL